MGYEKHFDSPINDFSPLLQVEQYEELEVLGQSINQLNESDKISNGSPAAAASTADGRLSSDKPDVIMSDHHNTKDLLDLTSSSDDEEDFKLLINRSKK